MKKKSFMHKIWMATVSDYVFWCKDVGFLRHHVAIVESFQFHSHKIFEKKPKIQDCWKTPSQWEKFREIDFTKLFLRWDKIFRSFTAHFVTVNLQIYSRHLSEKLSWKQSILYVCCFHEIFLNWLIVNFQYFTLYTFFYFLLS